jgi:RNA polymerase sigma-70 factor (ECF subfamily)
MTDAGGAADIDLWIDAFRGPLIGLLASWGCGWRAAEELAQDTFAEAWIGRDRFQGDPADPKVVGPWLRGIAFHLLTASRRRQALRTAEPVEAVDPPAPAPDGDDRRARLQQAFARLRPEQQGILRMFYLEQSSMREVAGLLGITEKAVESRLYHARRRLRELVGTTALQSDEVHS